MNKVPYYKMYGNWSLTIFSGRREIPRIRVHAYYSSDIYVRVGNILLGTKEYREFFLQNVDLFESLVSAADFIMATCSTLEDVKRLLKNGSLRYLGQYQPILEKK